MCCTEDPHVNKQVNAARCASTGALVMGLIFAIFGPLTASSPAFLGGLLMSIAASMLLCCGPKVRGQGKGIHVGALVLYSMAAVIMSFAAIQLILA